MPEPIKPVPRKSVRPRKPSIDAGVVPRTVDPLDSGIIGKDHPMADGTLNLMVARSDKSVWDKPTLTATLSTYDQERWIAAAFGSALAMIGARRGGFGGGLLATCGAALAIRAAMGRRDLGVAREWIDHRMKDRGWRADVVHDASEDSFPASDSPSWTPTAGVRPTQR